MPYAILRDESIPDAVRRIMEEQILRAREELLDTQLPRETRVHEARKRFKETRALIRLVRKPLGDQFAIENTWFRDAGRELAAVRDADAMLEALDKLELPHALHLRLRRRLRARRGKTPPLEGLIDNTVGQLVMAQARIALWPPMDDSFATLADGLQRTYREGRALLREAKTPEELHEWRKHVKTHWYHVLLLREVWPSTMKLYAGVMHDLSRALGDHHDLHVLRGIFRAPPSELLTAIDEQQHTLEAEARTIGARVYAEKPGAWLARMRNYWSAWKG